MKPLITLATKPRDDYELSRGIFLRLLAILTALNFWSFYDQILGLVGQNGILPIAPALSEYAKRLPGIMKYVYLPTLSWWTQNDLALQGFCLLGIFGSILLFFNIIPRIILGILWVLSLSLTVSGQLFTSYQWDILTLEVLFLSIFYAPSHFLPIGKTDPPSNLSVQLLRFLLFKLMFLGGLAKVTHADSTWISLTALNFHFETQPLPTPLAWYADTLPVSILQTATCLTLFIELIVPFFLFTGRRLRHATAYVLISFQSLIILTGNYGIFNFMTIILCLAQFDDTHLNSIKHQIPTWLIPKTRDTRSTAINVTDTTVLVFIAIINGFVFLSHFGMKEKLPQFTRDSFQIVKRFRSVNTYGLFGNMTTKRREILIQGSQNGTNWKSYSLPYKPDSPSEELPVTAGHMPRLDWQMWFAALKPPSRVKWFPRLLRKLLQGSNSVESLFAQNPFADSPPRYIRAVIYRYKFTSLETYQQTGRVWKRTNKQIYFPSLTLRGGQLYRIKSSKRSK